MTGEEHCPADNDSRHSLPGPRTRPCPDKPLVPVQVAPSSRALAKGYSQASPQILLHG